MSPYICSAVDAFGRLNQARVPQEHSHNQFITTVNTNMKPNNPDNIVDAVFGLFGNAAALQGQGDITDTGRFFL